MKEEIDFIKIRKPPRENWEEDFKRVHENGDDELLIDDIFEDKNLEEWE